MISDQFEQHIKLDGTPNFRDLGGRKNNNNKSMKRGRIFRSGLLSDLSSSDWKVIQQQNVTRIVDFRREDEVAKMPTQSSYPTYINHQPIGDGSHLELIKKAFTHSDTGVAEVVNFMHDINRDFPFKHADAFAQLFAELLTLQENESIIFHCSAGKDRTGFAAALILFALDFDRKQVFEDYLLTRAFFDPKEQMNRIMSMLPVEQLQNFDPQLLLPILEVKSQYLTQALETIENEMPMEQYLSEYMQLSLDDRKLLAAKFLHN